METPTTAHRGPVQVGPGTAPLAGEGTQPIEICGVCTKPQLSRHSHIRQPLFPEHIKVFKWR
jgi:hypothetical protein